MGFRREVISGLNSIEGRMRNLESDAYKPLDSSPVIRAIADGIVLACRNGNVEGAAEAIATLASCEKGIGRPLVIPVLRAIPDEG